MYRDRTPLGNSVVAARPENKDPDGCPLGLGTLGARMLLFIAGVPLLVGHTPKEGPAVTTETAASVLICDKLEIRGGLVGSICVAFAVVLILSVS